jgi:hypothetical protein
MDSTQVNIRSLLLEPANWGSSIRFSNELLTDAVASSIVDHETKMVMFGVRAMIWGENVHNIDYPLDWWQAFKDRWFPEWLKKRYPVLWKKWAVSFIYPELEARAGQKPRIAVYTTVNGLLPYRKE